MTMTKSKRPSKHKIEAFLTSEQELEALEMWFENVAHNEICELVGVSSGTLSDWVFEWRAAWRKIAM